MLRYDLSCRGQIDREAADIEATLKKLERGQSSDYVICDITKNADELLLLFQDGTEFALLSKQTSKALEKIISSPSIQADALADLLNLRETVLTAKNAKDTIFRVNINIYGSRLAQAEVGQHLSQSKAFLQHPEHVRPNTAYENPHVLALPGILNPTIQTTMQEAHEPPLKSHH